MRALPGWRWQLQPSRWMALQQAVRQHTRPWLPPTLPAATLQQVRRGCCGWLSSATGMHAAVPNAHQATQGGRPGVCCLHTPLAGTLSTAATCCPGAGWQELCWQRSIWGEQPRASTVTLMLRLLAGQLSEVADAGGAKAVSKALRRAEKAGMAAALAPPPERQPEEAPLPSADPGSLEALLQVYEAAAAADVHHNWRVAALVELASRQRVPLTAASCLALLACCEAAETAAVSGGGGAQHAALPLRLLLGQLFGEQAMIDVETAAYADAAEVQLPLSACGVAAAAAAVAAVAGIDAPAWAQEQEAAGEDEHWPAGVGSLSPADVRAALRRGDLSPAVLAACEVMEERTLVAQLSVLDRSRVRCLCAVVYAAPRAVGAALPNGRHLPCACCSLLARPLPAAPCRHPPWGLPCTVACHDCSWGSR